MQRFIGDYPVCPMCNHAIEGGGVSTPAGFIHGKCHAYLDSYDSVGRWAKTALTQQELERQRGQRK
jgi:hypothetical protein